MVIMANPDGYVYSKTTVCGPRFGTLPFHKNRVVLHRNTPFQPTYANHDACPHNHICSHMAHVSVLFMSKYVLNIVIVYNLYHFLL